MPAKPLLIQAIERDDPAMLEQVLAQGALSCARDERDFAPSPLMLAAHLESSACFERLLKCPGQDELWRPGARGWTPTHYACAEGSLHCLRLCQSVPGWDAPTRLSRHTPLMLAASAWSAPCVDLLLPLSDPFALNVHGDNAWAIACKTMQRHAGDWSEFEPAFARLALACGTLSRDGSEQIAQALFPWLAQSPDLVLGQGRALDALERACPEPGDWVGALDALASRCAPEFWGAQAIRQRQTGLAARLISSEAQHGSQGAKKRSL